LSPKRKQRKNQCDSLFFSGAINDCRDELLKAAIPQAQARLDRQEKGELNAKKLSRLLILKAKTCSKASQAHAFKKLDYHLMVGNVRYEDGACKVIHRAENNRRGGTPNLHHHILCSF
jgi:hypothetical protein